MWHVRKSSKGQKKIKDTSDVSRWVVLPFLTKALVVSNPVRACNVRRTLQASFPSTCNFIHIL